MDNPTATAASDKTDNKTEYREFAAEFEDFEGLTVNLTFHFRKPTSVETERAVKEVAKSVARGLKNLCVATVKPEERDELKEAFKKHHGLAATFGNEILERLGFNALGK